MSAMGIQFGVSIAIGALAGWWLDRRLETGPWLLVVGSLLGATAAFVDLFRLSADIRRRDQARPPGDS